MSHLENFAIKGLIKNDIYSRCNSLRILIVNISIIIGIVLSFLTTINTFTLNSDVANSAVVWDEIRKHGLFALKSWVATPDNWYFSVYPIHFIVFYLFGSASSTVILYISVAQVFLIALISSLIVKKVTGSYLSFFVLPVLCSFGWVAHALGFVSHPFSHNITNGYGLLCVYLYLINRIKSNIYLDLLICLLVLIAAISDPWFTAAFYLPLFIMTLVDVFYFKNKKFICVVTPFVVGIILFSHVLEKAFGLPVAVFEFGNIESIPSKIYWLLYGVGENINLIPYESDESFIASSIIWIVISAYAIYKIKITDLFIIFALVSSAVIASAFVLGAPQGFPASARFFTNITYFSVLIISIAYIEKRKFIFFMPIILMLASSLVSHMNNKNYIPEMQWNIDLHGAAPVVNEISEFLDKNNLHYGFGPYWGMDAIATSWLTGNKTTIRPVVFNRVTGEMLYPGRSQTFSFWYDPDNQPQSIPQFVAIMSDGEECPDLNLCLTGVKSQFGEPDQDLAFRGGHILVYHKKILGWKRIEIIRSGMIKFGTKDYKNTIWKGFRYKEYGYLWTNDYNSEMYFSSQNWKQIKFSINGDSYQQLKGEIFVNGKLVKSFDTKPGNVKLDFNAKNENLTSDIDIRIHFEQLKSPAEAGINSDNSKLGLRFGGIDYSVR